MSLRSTPPPVSRPAPTELARTSVPEPDGHVRDAARALVDHAGEVVRDTVAIGALEARRAVRSALPPAALGAAAAMLGAVGLVLGAIAVFIALRAAIPSTAGRLGLFAAVLLAAALGCGLAAARKLARRA
jgi:protein-S-isoprenylcysteine O-methyltransferase Ste14